MKNLTTRLSSTQQELHVLKEQRFRQNGGLTNATYSTVSQMNELNLWKTLNDTVETTDVLTNKVVLLTDGPFIFL